MNINVPLSTSMECSTHQWEEKIVRLKEQLNRSENQSRNYYRKLMKCHKLLYDAGSYSLFLNKDVLLKNK
jgi:hypothetical protein